MRQYTLLLLASLFPLLCPAQNLVPNAGMETYIQCPANLSGIGYLPAYAGFVTAAGWISPLQQTTPDYFNTCAGSTAAGVPFNTFGYKQPHSGNGYAGIIAYQANKVNGTMTDDYREYLECRLLQPLAAGHQYCISFYVSATIPSTAYSFNYINLSQIGLNVSKAETALSTGSTINLPYSVVGSLAAAQKDTTSWVKIAGTYTATGGEQWVTIGCFDALPAYTQVYPQLYDQGKGVQQYLYIDDISFYDINSADTIHQSHHLQLCDTSVAALLAGAPGGTSFKWSTGDTTASIAVYDSGTYWCTAHDGECETMEDTFIVQYIPYIPLQLSDTGNCLGQPVTIHANATYASYLWSTGATTNSLVADTSGTYLLTVTDGCQRQQTDSIQVYVGTAPPPPTVTDTVICQYAAEPVLQVAGSNIKWYYNSSTTTGVGVQPPVNTMDTGLLTYYVSESTGGCESAHVPIHVTVRYKPQSSPFTNQDLCAGDTLRLGVFHNDVQYNWNTGDTACCIAATKTGTYICTQTNSCGSVSDTARIAFSACDVCVVLPNAFTPNNDGLNDQFRPILLCPVTSYCLQVFNRWGQMVFRSTDPATGWDGRLQGLLVENCAYVYTLSYLSAHDHIPHQQSGSITVVY